MRKHSLDASTRSLLFDINAQFCNFPFGGTVTTRHVGSDPTCIDASLETILENLKKLSPYIKTFATEAMEDQRKHEELQAAITTVQRIFGTYEKPAPEPVVMLREISPDDLPYHEIRLLQSLVAGGKKIDAIKRVRELTSEGLKEAKEFVDGLKY